MASDRSDDLALALTQATKLWADRFNEVASCARGGETEATERVLVTADQMVAWLRRTASLSLVLVAIEDQDTGLVSINPLEGTDVSLTLSTSQQARYDILEQDARGFLTKDSLDLTVSGDNISAEIVETPDPATPNQLVVTAVQPGPGGTIVLDVPDNDTIAPVTEAFDVVAGPVAQLSLGTPVIEEQPAPPVV